jgi:hypothetical protein
LNDFYRKKGVEIVPKTQAAGLEARGQGCHSPDNRRLTWDSRGVRLLRPRE